MDAFAQVPLILPKMQDQKSSTLCWRSFSRWGRKGIAVCFENKGGQRFFNEYQQRFGGVITVDARSQIIDIPLTLIFKMQ